MNATQLKVVSVFTPLLLSMSISSAIAVPVPGGTLDPLAIPKYVSPLVIPPVLYDDGGAALNASIALRPAIQEILPNTGCGAASTAQQAAGGPAIDCTGTDGFPSTHLWAYGDPTRPSTFFNPSFTIEVTQNTTTTINWMNQLVADPVACQNIPAPTNEPVCNYLTHIIRDANGNPVVDQTLHWAAPNQNCRNGVTGPGGDTDCAGSSGAPYTGPIPMVTHVHGAHVGPVSDGYPEAWWLPNAVNIDCTNAAGYPATADTADDFDCNGTFYSDTASTVAGAGHAVYQYTNDQPTTTLWYHDHSLGITRLNVYAAGAGFWLIRTADDGESGVVSGTLPGPAPGPFATENPNADPAVRAAIREIPLAIQPKSFNADGSQFYPADRQFFEGLGDGQSYSFNDQMTSIVTADGAFPFLPDTTQSDIAPVWNPEAFFNTMVVNGKTWPFLDVAPERYRFRLLNASDSRFMNFALFEVLDAGADGVMGTADDTLGDELPFYQIGAEQSQLPNVVRVQTGFATPLPADGRDTCDTSYVDLVERLPASFRDRVIARLETSCVLPVRGLLADQALLVGPAERSDVIVDFNGLPDGTRVRMINTAPDEPFGGDFAPVADPDTTGQVMDFIVDSGLATTDAGGTVIGDQSTPVTELQLNANPGGMAKNADSGIVQDLALLEEESHLLCVEFDAITGAITHVPGDPLVGCPVGTEVFAPMAAVLGVNGSAGLGGSSVQLWDDPISTNPALDNVENWDLWNHSADAHPIHLHLVAFQVISRTDVGVGSTGIPEGTGVQAWESGWKDTVIAYPGQVTRVRAKFDKSGLYVWHCHILSHEDNEMMVPFCVGTPGTDCAAELFPAP